MNIKNTAFFLTVIFLGSLSPVAAVTIGGTDLQPAPDFIYATPGPGATAGYVAGSPDLAVISSPDNVGGSGLAQYNDTGLILINNGYLGASFGTLNNILAQGAAGNVSFDLYSMTGAGGNSAYWDLLLTDPNNVSNTVEVNAFSDNILSGTNPFNQGESVDASTSVSQPGSVYGGLFAFGSTWATVAGVVVDGTDLGDWNVAQLSIGVGGWDSGATGTAKIDSITLPGGNTVPDVASSALLLGIGLGSLLIFGYRQNHLAMTK